METQSFEQFAMNIKFFTKDDIKLTRKLICMFGSRHNKVLHKIGVPYKKTIYMTESFKGALFLVKLLAVSLKINSFTSNFIRLLRKLRFLFDCIFKI